MKALVEKIDFIGPNGVPIDISRYVLELNVYQSISDHYMQCELVIRSTMDIGATIPNDEENNVAGGFAGGELIVLQYGAEQNPAISNVFMLYERKATQQVTPGEKVYIVTGMSVEGMEAFPRKISKAYGGATGKTIGSMVGNIVNEYVHTKAVKSLYEDIRKSLSVDIIKDIGIEETSGVHKLIVPNMPVDNALDMLCDEADSMDHVPNFKFYETYRGFNFRNLGTLASQSPIMSYFYTEFNLSHTDRDQRKIVSYAVNSDSNFLDNAKEGLYKSKTIRLDMLRKTRTETVFDYQKGKSRFVALQGLAHRGNVDTPDVNVTLMTTRHGHNFDDLFYDERPVPSKMDQFLGVKRSYTKHITNFSMSVTVPGTTTLNVGDVVSLTFPLREMHDGSEGKSDPQLSGKYIITHLRNKMTFTDKSTAFLTVFDCIKDTQIRGE